MKELEIKEDDRLVLNVGKIPFSTDLKICRITVHTSDSDIAHFHLENKENDIDIKIGIFKPIYLDSNRKLNREEKKELQEFLKDNKDNFPDLCNTSDKSIWERIRDTWNYENNYFSNFPEQKYIEETRIPNYNELED